VAANVALATRLRGRPLYYNYVFLFVPETIGSIAYLSDHEDRIERTRCSVFTEMVGLDHPLVLQQSRKPGALINAYAAEAIRRRQGECRAYEYLTVAANDEKVFDGPCVGIPSISISRVDHEAHLRAMERARADGRREHLPPYPEYHSDRDNAALVSPGRVHETIQVLADLVELLEADFIPRPKFRGPAFLSRYDLWVDWRTNPQLHDKVISLMYALDEGMTAFQLARRFDLPMADVAGLLERFHQKGLIEKERIATAKDRG
jgi:aminopeptidase-like protein